MICNGKEIKVLVVDDMKDMCWTVSNFLRQKGITAISTQDGKKTAEIISRESPDAVLLDLKMPVISGVDVLKQIKKANADIPVIILTAYGEIRSAVEAVKLGAYDYISKPFDNDEVLITLMRAINDRRQKREINHLRSQLEKIMPLPEFMGSSPQIEKVFEQVKCVAPTDFTVVLYGETGSGKELVARAIHNNSPRRNGNFVVIDCGSIPDTLIESELFGYEKGAFTGAETTKKGHFELASGGTLFLDEIGNLSKAMQSKLLHALQERRIRRVGGKDFIDIDIRVIVAGNEKLEDLVKSGHFRQDLYHRLNEFLIEIPPLRKRKADILFLCKRFIDTTNIELNKHVRGVSEAATELLYAYNWPGNVRELKNVIKRAVLLANELIEPQHLPTPVGCDSQTTAVKALHKEVDAIKTGFNKDFSLREIVKKSINDIERKVIIEALIQTGGNKSKAAKILSIDYKTMYYKVKEYGITIKDLLTGSTVSVC
ncbi:MAG TPA: sigma-54-dependent transcriptional regulator [Candidatus Brocadiia bacterium]|nr:sigma-54-dependent Fis family transcriptional regulator [Planctomycetota bacterium]MDO8091955.1 sigma-54 dependent transcriptional regulator [Candidatus Brocadiales bacterium]